MITSEGALAPATLVRRAAALPAAGVVAVAGLGLLAVALVDGQAIRVVAAVVAAWLLWRGYGAATTLRERRVRAWIGGAAVVWVASEAARLIGLMSESDPLFAAITVTGLGLGAVGTFVSAARGRMRPADEAALYLDAASIFFAVTAAVLVIGAGLALDPTGSAILVHTAFFVAIIGATLLLDLSTRVPLRLVGPWEVLIGLALGAVGYVGLLVPAAEPARWLMHAVVAAGALLVGHGGAHWTAAEDSGARYLAVAAWLRGLLPLGSAVLTGILVVTLVSRPMLVDGWLRLVTGLALGLVAMCVIARQTVLLADRERVIDRGRRLADELTVAEAQYRSVVERVPGVVYVAEAGQHGRWHFVSPKIEELLGYTAEEWSADPTLWMRRMHPGDRDRMMLAEAGDHDRVETKGRWEYRLLAKDGRVVWVIDDEAVISRDADGHPTMVQGILVDISDRKDLEEQLRHQALHDPLTGLPNRVLFVDRLAHALVRRLADRRPGVLFLDLDDFKVINDSLGHAAGDELLRLVATRLLSVLRAEDTACRMGGDEFAFLLEAAHRDQVELVADRILRALAEPFEIAGTSVTLTASIGIAIAGDDGAEGSLDEKADEILRDADTAMYSAKSMGKGCVQVFERGMDEPVKRRRELRGALERAIGADELFLEYQPIIDMCDAATLGVEALVRWNHPQLGRLLPGDFIGLAEESGLIGPLGDWVMRRAAADMAEGSIMLSVNVSAHQLGEGALPVLVADVLRTTRLDPARLLLELTESTLASAGAGSEAELEAVQRLGVRIALDDFGSGYSSLEYLGRLPIDVLKIDRSLVERVDVEPQRQEVLRAISNIAMKLGVETIVEGIEREEQRDALMGLGFCRAQGFLFAPPLPLAEALALRVPQRQPSGRPPVTPTTSPVI
jgi:diguanylate cyclase (GGDEF)-like protein/PAS domain S-box-containing protein